MADNDIYYDQNGAGTGDFKMFGVEIMSNSEDRAKGWVTWYSQGKKSWTMHGSAVAANPRTEVSQRLIAEEPMALVSETGIVKRRKLIVDFQLGCCKLLCLFKGTVLTIV